MIDDTIPEEFREDYEDDLDGLDLICRQMVKDINYLLDVTFIEYKRGQHAAFVTRCFYCGSDLAEFSKPDIINNGKMLVFYLADRFNKHIQRKLKE